MTVTTIVDPPYFDPQALRVELTGMFQAHGSADAARPHVIDRLRRLNTEARAAAAAGLMRHRNGRRAAEGLSHFTDELVSLIYDYTVHHVYHQTNPADTERLAIIATGGYGRGLLAPGSDIDLLFLLPHKQTAWGESVVEHLLYALWDLKLKVGHATRTVEQCVRLANADMTIRTAVLDSRLILGDGTLFETMKSRLEREVIAGTALPFIEAKLAERDERHTRTGESRYRVEPNVKDGKGGLRDLHTLHWLAAYISGKVGGASAIDSPVFTAEERTIFRRSEDFLWTVRWHLHLASRRPEERLTFEYQPVLAEKLGYAAGRGGMRAVERFMKHYFLVAKDVGDLTAILCSSLEIRQLKTSPTLSALLNPGSWRTRRRLRRTTEFRIDNGRLNVADERVFERDPVNLIRIFRTAETTGTFFHPDAMRLIRRTVRKIDDRLRDDPDANRIFLELLLAKTNPEATLRHMNEAGVLGRFVPAFGKVVSMMQFNMYHHYTVDEHLIRTVGVLTDIEQGRSAGELPLSTRIIPSIQSRRALYVAAFLHDAGKGRKEDHSILGARIVREVGPRLGLNATEVEMCAWLVEQHLTMSTFAQSRDLSDTKTIRDFAEIVQSLERLKLLLLLTVADIRAVGPGTWNGWKGQLLRTLYHETETILSGGHSERGNRERIAAAHEAIRSGLADWPATLVDRFIERNYPDYWLKTEPRKQLEHARLMRRMDEKGLKLVTDCTTDAFTAVTELTVLAPNHPRLLALFAGACASAGANIVGAHISTTRDGLAVDTFRLQRVNEEHDERRRADRIGKTIGKLLSGEVRLDQLMAKRRPPEARVEAFTVEPEVIIDNTRSDAVTVIEVAGRDRTGLLYELTNALSDMSLDITSAHITTYGEKAVDVFYVTDLMGKKVTSESRQKAIHARLVEVLAPAPTPVPAPA